MLHKLERITVSNEMEFTKKKKTRACRYVLQSWADKLFSTPVLSHYLFNSVIRHYKVTYTNIEFELKINESKFLGTQKLVRP